MVAGASRPEGVRRVSRQAVQAHRGGEPSALLALLVAIVAPLAQGLEFSEPEQVVVSPVGDDVVHHRGRREQALLEAELAQGESLELEPASPGPPAVVVDLNLGEHASHWAA